MILDPKFGNSLWKATVCRTVKHHMSNKLFVGNLSFNTTENDLNDAFAAHGTVTETNLMMDRETGRPRGFGFITMSSAEEAQKAIEAMNGAGRLDMRIVRPSANASATYDERRARVRGRLAIRVSSEKRLRASGDSERNGADGSATARSRWSMTPSSSRTSRRRGIRPRLERTN